MNRVTNYPSLEGDLFHRPALQSKNDAPANYLSAVWLFRIKITAYIIWRGNQIESALGGLNAEAVTFVLVLRGRDVAGFLELNKS